jgi:hypothetical protein
VSQESIAEGPERPEVQSGWLVGFRGSLRTVRLLMRLWLRVWGGERIITC